jgi:hypothetical protein
MTFGDVRQMSFTCGVCEEKSEVTIVLSTDFPAAKMETPERIDYLFTTSKGDALVLRLATGTVVNEVMRIKGLTDPEINTAIIQRCVQSIGGGPVVDPVGFAKQLSIRDRTALIEELNRHQPSPDMVIKFNCPACDTEATISVSWSLLFRS